MFILNKKECMSEQIYNVGSSKELSIKSLAFKIAKIIGFKGKIDFVINKPDGIKRKYLDSSKINSIAWIVNVSLDEGIKKTYKWFLENYDYKY